MKHFDVETHPRAIPDSADDEAARRLTVYWKGQPITGVCQAAYRAFVFPVMSPAGVAVTTARSGSDHAWHNSVTVGTDQFHVRRVRDGQIVEDLPLNFYWDWPFQGRDAGRIVLLADDEATELNEHHLHITLRLNWEAPAPDDDSPREILATEVRTIHVRPGERANVIDVRSQLRPTQWDLRLGPCRHAYFTIRVADHLRVTDKQGSAIGGRLTGAGRREGETALRWQIADWIDFTGPDEQGRVAGVAVAQFPSMGCVPWYLVEYGSIRVNAHRMQERIIRRGEALDHAIRVIAHDGTPEEAGVDALAASTSREAI